MAESVHGGLLTILLTTVASFFNICAGQRSATCLDAVTRCIGLPPSYSSGQSGIESIAVLMSKCGTFPRISGCLDGVQVDQDCRAQADYLKDNMKDVLVTSGLCDRKEEAKSYESCFANPKLETACQESSAADAGPPDVCSSLTNMVSCWRNKVGEVCGKAESNFVQFVMKVLGRSIAKNLKTSCPGLDSGSSPSSESVERILLIMLCALFTIAWRF